MISAGKGGFHYSIDSKDGILRPDPPHAAVSGWDWVYNNIGKPVSNACASDYNAAVDAVNNVSKSVGGKQLVERQVRESLPPAAPWSGEWLAQNIAVGATAMTKYFLLAKCTGYILKTAGAIGKLDVRLPGLARITASDTTALISSSTAYNYFRESEPGESHLGNALGSAVGFGTFAGGSLLERNMKLPGNQLLKCLSIGIVRAGVGSVGGASEVLAADAMTRGAVPQWNDKVTTAIITGGTMNLLLPALGNTKEYLSSKLGLGVTLDHHVQSLGLAGKSKELDMLCWRLPYAKVKETNNGASWEDLKTQTANLTKDSTGADLAHALYHLNRARRGGKGVDANWKDGAGAHVAGRLSDEVFARKIEKRVAGQLGISKTTTKLPGDRSDILGLKTVDGTTYGQHFLSEYNALVKSNGKVALRKDFSSVDEPVHNAIDQRIINCSDERVLQLKLKNANPQGVWTSPRDYRNTETEFVLTPMNEYRISVHENTPILLPKSLDGQVLERVVSIMDQLPDSQYVRRLVVSDRTHPMQPYFQQKYGSEQRVYGETREGNFVEVYYPQTDQELRKTIFHEWAHAFWLMTARLQGKFAQVATKIGKPSGHVDVNDSAEETFAILTGESLLSNNPFDAYAAARKHPEECRIIRVALSKVLESQRSVKQCTLNDYYKDLFLSLDELDS